MSDKPPKDAIRNAATVILVRRDAEAPRVLMGQRGKNAAFFPNKFVFPGGAIDADDHAIGQAFPPPAPVEDKLAERADAALGPALVMTAVRELWEEAGLALALSGTAPDTITPEWENFFAAGHVPNAGCVEFVFRAITPPGRPRRFDARFFMADAGAVAGDLDDFSGAEDELSHLSWLTLSDARGLDLPFITEVVLAEVEARLNEPGTARPIPFFYPADGKSFIDQL